jgi:hypothetical protein
MLNTIKALNIMRMMGRAAPATATLAAPVPQEPAATTDPEVSQARLFGLAYAKDAGSEMLRTIKKNSVDAELVTKICLGVSMPHQIGFILGLAALRWDTVTHVMESITLILGAVGIPVAVDYLILICIRTLSARAAATISKVVAFVAMLFPIGVSAYVNFAAPAAPLIKGLFVVAVLLIPTSQAVRALNRPNFRKIDRMEREVKAQVATVGVQPEPAPTVASSGDIRKAQLRKADAARELARVSPNLSVGQLAAATGVSRSTASGILKKSGPSSAPISPGRVSTAELNADMAAV